MADPLEGAKDLLVTAGVGTFGAASGWSIDIAKFPETPDSVVALMPRSGLAPNPAWLLDFPGIQILVRGDRGGYIVAQAKAQAIKDALLGLPSQTIDGDRWVSITMDGDIGFLHFDENNRPIFSLNFRLIIQPASGTNRIALSA